MMQWRTWIAASIGLNLVLVAVAGYVEYRRAGSAPAATHPRGPRVPPRALLPLGSSPSPAAESQTGRFTWNQLESEDLRVYGARLRAVGCPEKTLRDVLLPILEDTYEERIRNLRASNPGPFWQGASQRAGAERERGKAIQGVKKEKAALALELFGSPVDLQALREWRRDLAAGLFLGLLPEGKPEEVVFAVKKMRDQIQAIQEVARGILTPDDIDQLYQLIDQMRTDLASRLTPVEMEELEARATAAIMPELFESFFGLEMTGPELRALTTSIVHSDDPFLRNRVAHVELTAEEKDQMRRHVKTQMRNALGEARFTQYQRMQDRAYRKLAKFARQHNLPSSTADTLYAMDKAVEDEQARIRKNTGLTAEQREAAMAEARQLAQQEARRILGDRLFEELGKE